MKGLMGKGERVLSLEKGRSVMSGSAEVAVKRQEEL
jgi:hypothetical protein